ncbi:hypothetical protein [Saccharothrix sp. Mg75]|uniref:hypothetical protein n=1 Tax=Saccharothrix sp. Mg75 TaxID=3445357 RepID=UPI003EECB093
MGAGDRGLWWDVWWPWVVVWGVTALAVVVFAVTAALAWRARHKYGPEPHPLGVPVYVDGPTVLNIMSVLGLKPVPAEVTARAVLNKDGKIEVPGLSVTGGVARVDEETRTFRETYEPIDLVAPLVKALSDGNQLLYADLAGRHLLRNVAVERHLRTTRQNPASVPLQGINAYVSVVGWFRTGSDADGVTVLLAPFGPDGGDAGGQWVRVDCAHEWLLDGAVPEGTFYASCLGRVQSWKAEEGHLVVRPIAMFQ